MNKVRRKEINKAYNLIYEAKEILERAAEEEHEYFDIMPETLQDSKKASAAVEAADALDEAVSGLEEVLTSCEAAVQ